MALRSGTGTGIFKSIGGGIFAILKLLFSKNTWFISTTLIFLMILLYGSIIESVQQQSAMPFIQDLGSFTIGVDSELKNNVDEIINYEPHSAYWNWWFILLAYLTLLSTIWIYFVITKLFFHAWMFIFGDCEPWKPVLLALATIAVAQCIYISWLTSGFYIPLQGIWYLIINSPQLLAPLTDKVKIDNPYPVNITNATL